MENKDTISLLKECSAGIRMAVSSIDDVLDKVSNEKLKNSLIDFKDKHTKLGNEIHGLLLSYNEPLTLAVNLAITLSTSSEVISSLS